MKNGTSQITGSVLAQSNVYQINIGCGKPRPVKHLSNPRASNKEIGEKLFLTEKTVKHYMTNILQKLQVRNRVEAALLAQRSAQAGDQMGVAAKLTKVKASN